MLAIKGKACAFLNTKDRPLKVQYLLVDVSSVDSAYNIQTITSRYLLIQLTDSTSVHATKLMA